MKTILFENVNENINDWLVRKVVIMTFGINLHFSLSSLNSQENCSEIKSIYISINLTTLQYPDEWECLQ